MGDTVLQTIDLFSADLMIQKPISIQPNLLKQNKFIMHKQQQYDEIFTHRLTNQNLQAVKKFFVFQPGIHGSLRPPESNLIHKSKDITTANNKRHGPKFPGGFQQSPKVPASEEQSQDYRPPFVLQSKKAPTSSISSFLLGITGRINKQCQRRASGAPSQQKDKYEKMTYQEVMSNLSRIRRKNSDIRNKYASVAAVGSNNSQTIPNNPQLPLLQKRLMSPDRKNTGSNSFTPTLSNKSTTPSFSESPPVREKQCQKLEFLNSQRALPLTISSKIVSIASQQPLFMRGYLSYEQGAKNFLDFFQSNIQIDPRIKKSFQGITATNYIVLDRENLSLIAEKKSDQQIQIASLTKIMTCYLSILVCQKYKVILEDVQVRVTDRSQQMPGTSAELQAGDILTLKDLLYGLMLPSGNDASIAIAETIGKIIQKNKKKTIEKDIF